VSRGISIHRSQTMFAFALIPPSLSSFIADNWLLVLAITFFAVTVRNRKQVRSGECVDVKNLAWGYEWSGVEETLESKLYT
jgi:hypothetical protein